MIYEAQNGFCCEEATANSDFADLKAYIKKIYSEFTLKGEIEFNPNYSYINNFDYKELTKQLEKCLSVERG